MKKEPYTESWLFKIGSRIADYMLLSVLWLVTSLPVITVGAATTAAYYVAFQIWDMRDGYLIKDFLRSFRQNFLQATELWLSFLAVALLWLPAWKYYSQEEALIGLVGLLVQAALYLMTITYVFPYLAKFHTKLLPAIQNSLLLSIRFFGWTLLMALADVFISWFFERNYVLLLMLPGALICIHSFLLHRIFRLLIEKGD